MFYSDKTPTYPAWAQWVNLLRAKLRKMEGAFSYPLRVLKGIQEFNEQIPNFLMYKNDVVAINFSDSRESFNRLRVQTLMIGH